MKILTVTPSTWKAVTLADTKAHLRITSTNQDDMINDLITIATDRVEGITNRALTKKKLRLYIDNWPCGDSIELPYPPLSTSTDAVIQYKDKDSSTITLSSTVYRMDAVSEPGRVCLDYNESWPTGTLHNVNPISVQYLCGYTATSNVPERLKQAVKIFVEDMYENTGSVVVGRSVQELTEHVKNLIRDYRIHTF